MLTLESIKSFYSASPNAYLILLPNAPRFTIADANEAFLKITNMLRSDIIGKGIFEAFPASLGSKEVRAINASLEHALRVKKTHKRMFHRYDLEKAGSYEVHFWNFDTFSLLDENNEVQFIIQNPVDVTSSVIFQHEQKILNNGQQADTNFQSPLINSYPDAIFSLDLKGNFLSANRTLLGLTEYTRDAMYDRDLLNDKIKEQNKKLHEIAWTQSHLVRSPLVRIMGLIDLLCDNSIDETAKNELLLFLKESAKDLDAVIWKIINKTNGQ